MSLSQHFIFPDDLSRAVHVCLHRRTSTITAGRFLQALDDFENGVVIEVRDGLRPFMPFMTANAHCFPAGIPTATMTNMAPEHRRLLLKSFRIQKTDEGMIDKRDGLDLARYYIMHLHIYTLRRVYTSRPGDPERDLWYTAQARATRLYFWVFGQVSIWNAEIKSKSEGVWGLVGQPARPPDYIKGFVQGIRQMQDLMMTNAVMVNPSHADRKRPELDIRDLVDEELTRWE